jgi:hypothetical protein
MAWQGTLGQMKEHGTRVAQTASCKCPSRWIELDLDQLLAAHGPDWLLWDRRPPCARCGAVGHYMASPGPSTPYRPLLTGPGGEFAHAQFLRSFGFTKRDVLRIKAMAETVTLNYMPAALNDLDVPYRVGACIDGEERHSSGEVLGLWAGRKLLYWKMMGAEFDRWQARRPGPRKV